MDQGEATHEMIQGGVPDPSTKGFLADGETYDANRPSYTEQLVEEIAKTIKSTQEFLTSAEIEYNVLELGAGTGIMTQALVKNLSGGTKLKYLATDPSEDFLRILKSKNLPDVAIAKAVANDIPLPDSSVQSVLCAQCFHWFSDEESLKSIRRVMVRGGKLILVWNLNNYSGPVMSNFLKHWEALRGKMDPAQRHMDNSGEWRKDIEACPLFKFIKEETLPGIDCTGDINKFLGVIATYSTYNALPDGEKEEKLKELGEIIRKIPGTDPSRVTLSMDSYIIIFEAT